MSGWVWSKEALPEEGERVLCLVREVCFYEDTGEKYDCYMAEGEWRKRNKRRMWFVAVRPDVGRFVADNDIIAWMKLPKLPKGWQKD